MTQIQTRMKMTTSSNLALNQPKFMHLQNTILMILALSLSFGLTDWR